MESTLLKGLSYLLCKCHAKILLGEHEAFSKVTADMGDIKMEGAKAVKFENLYDLMFNGTAEAKSNQTKKLLINGDHLDFLEQEGKNIQIVDTMGGKRTVEVEKMKITRQFKLVNPVPKFQSVPATPQFFDIAGTYLEYPSQEEALNKYRATGGLFKKLTGFWRS
jgi:hypothetical protein